MKSFILLVSWATLCIYFANAASVHKCQPRADASASPPDGSNFSTSTTVSTSVTPVSPPGGTDPSIPLADSPPASSTPANPSGGLAPSNPPVSASPIGKAPSGKGLGVRVSGNKLVDASGNEFRCHGVNLQGTEYKCIQGDDYSEGTIDQTYVDAMKKWNINCVRIPLNEDCLLGSKIPNVKNGTYIGSKYMEALKAEVDLMLKNDLVVILDLHWVHGDSGATKQYAMADKYTIDFWKTIAKNFPQDSIFYDLYNEPFVKNWDCWLKGGSSCTSDDQTNYGAVGMQDIVTAIRSTGSKNPILMQGIGWGGDISGFLTHTPVDPAKQLIAGVHIYNFGACVTPECYKEKIWPTAAKFPMIIGEIGQNDCKHDFVDKLMAEADKVGVSYLGWAWFATGDCAKGPTLISSWDGTPTGLGEGIKAHYLTLGGAGGASTLNATTSVTASIGTANGTSPNS